MTERGPTRRRLLLAAIAGPFAMSATEARPLFWSRLAGNWLGELTYLNGDLEPIIQTYHAVLDLRMKYEALSLTEFKFYPPGTELARDIAGDDLPADQGIEVVSEISGPVTGNRWGTRTDGVYELVDDQTLVRHMSSGGSVVPRYVTYWTLTTDRTLIITNLGVLSTRFEADYYNRPLEPKRLNSRLGELKGCSIFRYVRMEETGREQQLDRLRAEYNVRLSFDRRTTKR